MNHYVACFQKFATFTGRSGRAEYWMFTLFNLLISFALNILTAVTEVGIFAILGLVYGLIALLPGLAVFVRRMHDTGRSGWWFLLGFVPLIGVIVLIVFLVQPSQPGDNQYGPEPV